MPPERPVTIITDARVTIRWMASEETDHGQMYALQARNLKHTRCYGRPDLTSPSRSGGTLHTREYQGTRRPTNGRSLQRSSQTSAGWIRGEGIRAGWRRARCRFPDPSHISGEKKWAGARRWVGGRASRKKYKMLSRQRRGGTAAGSCKRLASRVYQLETGHCLTGQYLHWAESSPPLSAAGVGAGRRRGITSSRCVPNGRPSGRSSEQRYGSR